MIWSSFILGLLGGLHCLGMCGPIVLSLPLANTGKAGFFAGRFLYNTGRIFTYSLLGGFVAILGTGAYFFNIQQFLSIGLGAGMIFWGLIEMGIIPKINLRIPGAEGFRAKIFSVLGKSLQSNHPGRLFFGGMANGLLPCGLVYLGLGTAALAENIFQGALSMLLFGLGTFPVMLGISLAGNVITPSMRGKLNRVLPFIILITGILLIVRGLGLGIPYLSPEWNGNGADCCRKHI